MILRRLLHLEEETKANIAKEQQRLHSWEITEQEYEERYGSLMDDYRLRTFTILSLRNNIYES